MNEKNIKTYIQKVKSKYSLNISDYFLEKDYILSLFLSNLSKEETPNLDNLIFKGGTLLTKNHLKYHRISEDLDFIHQDSNIIRNIETKGKKETQIKRKIIPILQEIENIAQISKLEFKNDRNDKRYIIQRNSRQLYILKLYYHSQYTGFKSYIKIEISFVEDLIDNPKKEEIKNLLSYYPLENVDLKITNYNLEKAKLQTYSIEEIILEKIRASITRIQFKPRDVFDLYLINKQTNIFNQRKEDIFKKLEASPFEFNTTISNIENFIKEEITIKLEDIYDLSLIEFDENDFMKFTNELIKYLKQIAKEFLEDIKKE